MSRSRRGRRRSGGAPPPPARAAPVTRRSAVAPGRPRRTASATTSARVVSCSDATPSTSIAARPRRPGPGWCSVGATSYARREARTAVVRVEQRVVARVRVGVTQQHGQRGPEDQRSQRGAVRAQQGRQIDEAWSPLGAAVPLVLLPERASQRLESVLLVQPNDLRADHLTVVARHRHGHLITHLEPLGPDVTGPDGAGDGHSERFGLAQNVLSMGLPVVRTGSSEGVSYRGFTTTIKGAGTGTHRRLVPPRSTRSQVGEVVRADLEGVGRRCALVRAVPDAVDQRQQGLLALTAVPAPPSRPARRG